MSASGTATSDHSLHERSFRMKRKKLLLALAAAMALAVGVVLFINSRRARWDG